jgi:hypothetical protein
MTVALSKISDAGGSLNVVKVGEKPLTQEMLGTGVRNVTYSSTVLLTANTI